MPGHTRILTVTISACCLLQSPGLPADDSPETVADQQVMSLVRQLRSDQQRARVQAQRELTELGGSAIPGIERAASRAALDQLPYLIAVLERMFVGGCPPEADEAERALERLAQSDRSAVSGRVAAILTAHQQLRERRAVAALRQLGADVVYDPLDSRQPGIAMGGWPVGSSSGIVVPGHDLARIEVWLHDDMRGGEEALRHVMRLEDNWSVRTAGITVYSIAGNGVSTEAVQLLAGRLNKANIQERGASLGITYDGRSDGCTIQDVLPGGTAAATGLGHGDEILAMDGEPVPTFAHLVARLLERSPGDSATLSVSHFGNEPREIEITLGSWRPVVEERKREIEDRSRGEYPSIEDQIPNRFPFAPDLPVK